MNITEYVSRSRLPAGLCPAVNRAVLARGAVAIALCLLPVVTSVRFLDEPFERDEAVYATVARTVLHGGLPYRDVFDHKLPMIYGWYGLSFRLFGERLEAPRLLAMVSLVITSALILVAARLLFASRRSGFLAAGSFGLATGLVMLRADANPEAFMLAPLTAALVCFLAGIRRGGWGWFLSAGVLSGLAIATKQVAVWNWLVLLGMSTVAVRRRTAPGLSRSAPAWTAGGALAVLAAMAVPFVATGTFRDFLYANVTYNALYLRELPLQEKAIALAMRGMWFAVVAAPWVATTIVGTVACLRSPRFSAHVLVWWSAASLIGVASTGRFYPNYFVQLLPAMALLTVPAVTVLGRWRRTRTRAVVFALGAGVCVYLVAGINMPAYLAATPQERHIAKFMMPYAERSNRDVGLGAWLAAHTRPDDYIYNYGRQTEIYFYADRRAPTRFIYDRPFWLDERTLDVALAELSQRKPVYIVDTIVPPLVPADEYAKYHPRKVTAFLDEYYEFEGERYGVPVYRLKPGPWATAR